MTPERRVRTLFAALMLLALVLVTLDARDGAEAPRGAATAALEPLGSPLSRALQPVRDLDDAVRDLLATRAENRRLRAENERLRARRASDEDLARQVAELRALIGLQDELDLATVATRVISVTPSNFEWTLTIDVGTDDGVRRGMAVVSGDGLVGRVLLATGGASRVLLVIDPNFSVAARVLGGDGLGVLDGRGSEPMRFSPLDARLPAAEGDEIVTASFPGSAVPAGIPIGRLAAREDTDSRLQAAYAVAPFVDVAALDHLLVVVAPPAPEVPLLEDSSGVPIDVPGPPPGGADADADDATGSEVAG
ncbi:MAG: rod shape-determining protein MreC [Nitriliruptoraceae bacterium]